MVHMRRVPPYDVAWTRLNVDMLTDETRLLGAHLLRRMTEMQSSASQTDSKAKGRTIKT